MINKLIGLKFIFVSIEEAIKKHNIKAVVQYINAGKDIHACNYKGETLLYTASSFKAVEIVELLLKNGANPNTLCKGEQAILNSVHFPYYISESTYQKTIDTVKLLVDYGADVNQIADNNCLTVAIAKENLNIVKILVNAGANTNYVDEKRNNLLHIACMHGNKPIVQLFTHLGANTMNSDNNCPLHLLCQQHYDFFEIVNLLLQYNANPMKNNLKEKTPFELALSNGSYKTVKAMIPHVLHKSELEKCENLVNKIRDSLEKEEILKEISKGLFRFHLEEKIPSKEGAFKQRKI